MGVRVVVGVVVSLACAVAVLEPVVAEASARTSAAAPDAQPLARRSKAKRRPSRRRLLRKRRRQPTPAPPKDPPAEPPPMTPALSPDSVQAMLQAHNVIRETVDAPALTWSNEVAQTARAWAGQLQANGCGIQHNPDRPYGENIYWSSGSSSPQTAVQMWTAEAQHYDAEANTCAQGQQCGHYTQVVWANSRKLGCAMASCGSARVWVCNYDPPGNWVGQRPF